MAEEGSSSSIRIQAKLVLLGAMGAGKTSIALRFVKGQYYENQESTIGAAFFSHALAVDRTTIKLDIWDTAGQERYHSLTPMYYRGAAAAAVVYDISNTDSFEQAKKWVDELQRQASQMLAIALVANKADLQESDRNVPEQEAQLYAKEHKLFFIETSAKTGQNVNELFLEIANKLANARPQFLQGIQLQSERNRRRMRRNFCCSG